VSPLTLGGNYVFSETPKIETVLPWNRRQRSTFKFIRRHAERNEIKTLKEKRIAARLTVTLHMDPFTKDSRVTAERRESH